MNKKIKLNKNNYSLINSNKKNELKLLIGENVNTKEIIYLPEKKLISKYFNYWNYWHRQNQ